MLTSIPINGVVFNMIDMSAINLESGKTMKLNKDAVKVNDIILTYIDGEYVVKNDGYKKISEDDLFKG